MATRGWESYVERPTSRAKLGTSPPRRKYRNVRVEIGGQRFDSRAEAGVWILLREREQRGEIYNLRRQVPFALKTAVVLPNGHPLIVQVSVYIADFDYVEAGQRHVIDVKRPATSTAVYRLKRKWLELQEGIVIEEIAG